MLQILFYFALTLPLYFTISNLKFVPFFAFPLNSFVYDLGSTTKICTVCINANVFLRILHFHLNVFICHVFWTNCIKCRVSFYTDRLISTTKKARFVSICVCVRVCVRIHLFFRLFTRFYCVLIYLLQLNVLLLFVKILHVKWNVICVWNGLMIIFVSMMCIYTYQLTAAMFCWWWYLFPFRHLH